MKNFNIPSEYYQTPLFHYRSYSSGELITFAALKTVSDGDVESRFVLGWSICSPKDNFSKVTGRNLAVENALTEEFNKSLVVSSTQLDTWLRLKNEKDFETQIPRAFLSEIINLIETKIVSRKLVKECLDRFLENLVNSELKKETRMFDKGNSNGARLREAGVKIFHVRNRVSTTVLLRKTVDENTYDVAYSRCSPYDNFSKNSGRGIAEVRLLATKLRLVIIVSNDKIDLYQVVKVLVSRIGEKETQTFVIDA